MGDFAAAALNEMLDCFATNATWDLNTQVWVQLHTGDPGATGTQTAGETNRKQATFGTPASGGAISNTVAIEWTDVSSSETYTYISLWSASTAGTYLGKDDITSATVTAGDTFRIPVSDLDLVIVTTAQ